MCEILKEFEEILENIDNVTGENRRERVPKRYIRDVQNSIEFFDAAKFRPRYRFRKEIVADILLPLIIGRLQKSNNRGLPILQLLPHFTIINMNTCFIHINKKSELLLHLRITKHFIHI